MSEQETRGFKTFIAAKTLPWLLLGLGLFCTLLFFLFKDFIDNHLETQHQRYNQYFIESYENARFATVREIQNIAGNDLIINALVDTRQRLNYLPMFIRSYSLQNTDHSQISLTDFQGKVISYGGVRGGESFLELYDWRNKVLEQGENVVHFDENGMFVAVPVSYAELPEGAVVGRINLADFQSMMKTNMLDGMLVFTDSERRVLYSSDPDRIPLGTMVGEALISDWYQYESKHGRFFIMSAQPEATAYQEVYLLIVVLIGAFVATLIGTLMSIYLAASQASSTVNRLVGVVTKLRTTGLVNTSISSDNQPLEISILEQEFNSLIGELTDSNISKLRFSNIIDSLTEALVVFDLERNVVFSNHAFIEFLRVVGIDKNDCYGGVTPEGVLFSDRQLKEGYSYEKSHDCLGTESGDQQVTMRWQCSQYLSDKGKSKGIILVGVDITELLKTEIDLRIKNRAMDEASNGIVITSAGSVGTPIVYVNKGFERITGYNFSDVVGRECSFLQGKETEKEAIKSISRAIKTAQPINITLLNYRKNGESFYNELLLTPVKNEKGLLTHYLGVQNDVTERILNEKRLSKAISEAEEARQIAEASSRAKADFVANMSHEIRTPMNGVIGMLGLVKKSELSDKQSKQVGLALTSAKALLALLNDILDFSKIDAGKLEIESTRFNLLELVSDLVQSFGGIVQEKGIEIVLDACDLKYHHIKADPNRIRQILLNLIGNAIKFTHKGEVVVTVGNEIVDDRLVLQASVRDSGVGIPKEKLDKLFEAFTQADTSTTRRYGGTGLGLTIVRQLCNLMNGDVSVESEVDRGSCFTFHIRSDELIDINVGNEKFIDPATPKFLIVGERDQLALALGRQLEAWGGTCQAVSNAPEALGYLRRILGADTLEPKDIVFIDNSLPELNGLELCQLIRSEPGLSNVALILMLKFDDKIEHKALDNLGVRCINKPLTPLTLRNCLNQLLKKDATDVPHRKTNFDSLVKRDKRILLVEDNSVNQEVAKGLLEVYAVEIVTADNGESALQTLARRDRGAPFDLIFMDCQMPIMDGYEATRAIRLGEAGEECKSIPIIAMTANAMKGDAERCYDAGMNRYVSKPVDPDELDVLMKGLKVQDIDASFNDVLQEQHHPEISDIWDSEKALKRVRNKKERLLVLLDMFLNDMPERIEALNQAVNDGDWQEISNLSHIIRGLAGNLSGIAMEEHAKLLENQISSHNSAEVERLLKELKRDFDRLSTVFSSYRESAGQHLH